MDNENIAKKVFDLFVVRDDAYAVQLPKREAESKAKYSWRYEKVTPELISKHVEGLITIGVPQLSMSGMLRYICYDFDNIDLKSVLVFYEYVLAYFKDGIIIEASGSPNSYHIWVLFSKPVAAEFARDAGKGVIKSAELGILFEFYPKQLKPTKTGNFVKLPFGINRSTDVRSQILDHTGKPVEDNGAFLMSLKLCDPDRLGEVVEEKPKLQKPLKLPYEHAEKDFPCVAKILSGVEKEQPSRHDAAIVLASYLINYKIVGETAALKTLLEWNRERVKPPLSNDDIITTLKSAADKGYVFTCKNPKLESYCVGRDKCFERPSVDIDENITFEKWKAVCVEDYPLLWEDIEITMSAACILFLRNVNKPFALILIGPSGSGKTVICELFDAYSPFTIKLDDFSSASFITQSSDVEKEDAAAVDLLPKLDNKIFVTSELGPIFSKDEQTLTQLIGVLTRILDGMGYIRAGGVHGLRGEAKEMKFIWIGASVPFKWQVFKIISTLGPRLYFNAMVEGQDDFEDILNSMTGKPQRERQSECRKATMSMIYMMKRKYPDGFAWDTLRDRNVPEHKEKLRTIHGFSLLLKCLRGQLQLWPVAQGEFQWAEPQKETAYKPFESLCSIARGHALLYGRDYLNDDDIWIAARIALKSAPMDRVKMLSIFLKAKGPMSPDQIGKILNCHHNTAGRILKELEILKIIERVDDKETSGRPAAMYKLHSQFSWLFEDKRAWLMEKAAALDAMQALEFMGSTPTKPRTVFSRVKRE